MINLIMIACGGAIGAVLRYGLSTAVYQWLGRGFPWGTLAVNLVGSLFMGFLYAWLIEKAALGAEIRALLLVGLLGALTTFSTFSIETLMLIEQAQWLKAGLNMVLSVALCLMATALGLILGRL